MIVSDQQPHSHSSELPVSILLNAESLAGFACPEWDPWIAQILATEIATFEGEDPATARESVTIPNLARRFPSVRFERPEDEHPANKPILRFWFGASIPQINTGSRRGPIVHVLHSADLSASLIEKSIAAGTTFFLSDLLPDEIPTPISSTVLREWLSRFIFVPPCPPTACIGRGTQSGRKAIVCRRSPQPATGASSIESEIVRIAATELDLDLLDADKLVSLPDPEFAKVIGRHHALLIHGIQPQVAHRICLSARATSIAIEFTSARPGSPLRLVSGFRTHHRRTRNLGEGAIRHLAKHMVAFRQRPTDRSAVEHCENPPATAAIVAHILRAIGIGNREAGRVPPLWSAHPAWLEWLNNANSPAPELRIHDAFLSFWVGQGSTSALLGTLAKSSAVTGASHLWFECAMTCANAPCESDIRTFLSANASWCECCEQAFARFRAHYPDLEDLRGPWAAALADIAAADPVFGDRLGLPAHALHWLEQDATEHRQSSDYALKRTFAVARWGSLSEAGVIANTLAPTDPRRPGLVAQLIQARLQMMHGQMYSEEKRSECQPALLQMREMLSQEAAKYPGQPENETVECFLSIYLGETTPVVERLDKAMEDGSWPVLLALRIAVQMFLSGHVEAGRHAAVWIGRKAGTLQSSTELAFAASAALLAGHTEVADALDQRLREDAPDFFRCADAFALHTRALALASRGDIAASRELYGKAVALRPALLASRTIMEGAVAKISGRPLFSLVPQSS